MSILPVGLGLPTRRRSKCTVYLPGFRSTPRRRSGSSCQPILPSSRVSPAFSANSSEDSFLLVFQDPTIVLPLALVKIGTKSSVNGHFASRPYIANGASLTAFEFLF